MNKNKILKVSIVMGSQSDYKIMKLCEKTLKNLGILFETKIISSLSLILISLVKFEFFSSSNIAFNFFFNNLSS